jgi:hypothetical protein
MYKSNENASNNVFIICVVCTVRIYLMHNQNFILAVCTLYASLELYFHIFCSLTSLNNYFFSLALQPQFGPWPTSMKLSVSLRFSRS